MIDPVFWLGVSILLVAVSIAAVLVAAMPAFQELARAARSAEKLFDTLNREMPPTLKSIRDTGSEIIGLTDDMSEGVQGAGRVVQQVDQSISGVKQKTQVSTRSVVSGVKAAWKAFSRSDSSSSKNIEPEDHRAIDRSNNPPRLPASTRPSVEMEEVKIGEVKVEEVKIKEVQSSKPDGSGQSVDASDASVEAEIALSHYSESVAKLTEDLENIRDRLTQEKSGDVINK